MSSSATNAYFASDFTWEYENGVLTVTSSSASTSGYFMSGITYKLFYVTGGTSNGGGTTEPNLQSKSVTPSETEQTIEPDSGYDGLSQVTVEAIPADYIGSSVTKLGAKTYTPHATSTYTIAAGQYLEGDQQILPVPTETKTITENGTYTPSDGKFFSQVTVNVPTGGGDGLPDVIVAGDTPILGSWVGSQVTATTATDTGLSVTIPQDGTYRFYIPATKGTSYGTTTNPTIQIYKNEVAAGDAIAITTATPTQPYSIDLECSAEDVIKVYATAVQSTYSTTAVTAMALIACIDK